MNVIQQSPQQNEAPPRRRLLSEREVVAVTTMRRGLIAALIERGQFPAPVRLSEKRKAWVADEIEQWISERVAERDQHTGCGKAAQ